MTELNFATTNTTTTAADDPPLSIDEIFDLLEQAGFQRHHGRRARVHWRSRISSDGICPALCSILLNVKERSTRITTGRKLSRRVRNVALATILLTAPAFWLGDAVAITLTDCALQGGLCDASNTCKKYEPGPEGPEPVILGTCEPDPAGGGPGGGVPPKLVVRFINNTRNRDLVVSARDGSRGLPGGMKELTVEVSPKSRQVTLTITRTNKNGTGSASFDKNNPKQTTLQVKDGQTITIYGGEVSNKPRNMKIIASRGANDTNELATFEFTVFRVDIFPITSGPVVNAIPQTALANSGKGPQKLLAYYRDFNDPKYGLQLQFNQLGHFHFTGPPNPAQQFPLAYGGIVFNGIILPKNIKYQDFNINPGPGPGNMNEAFNWTRERSTEECTIRANGTKVPTLQETNKPDDSTDDDEDLIPEDGFIWTLDTPVRGFGDVFEGDRVRGRYQFKETVEYAGVKVSVDLPWFWRASQVVSNNNFLQLSDIAGDNMVGVGTTLLTPDLTPGSSCP